MLSLSQVLRTAKRALPILSPLYGHLSEQFVHIGGRMHQRPHLLDSLDADDGASMMNLQLIKSVIMLHGIAVELVCFDRLDTHRYWKRHEPGHYSYSPSAPVLAQQARFVGHPLESSPPPEGSG
jgi:hypothetical protein